MSERLQKILSMAGVASRREAEKYITAGRVTVNGTVVTELGAKAVPGKDRIAVDGKDLVFPERKLYILLNKPVGYVTTVKDPQGRPVVIDLLKDLKERVYPVGRLDYNTEGLLLLTNDGEWANRLMHPRHEVEKEYLVRVRGTVSPEQLRRMAEGVELEEGKTAPAKVNLLRETGSSTWISVVIHEGRYRQVRRMCEAVSLAVARLKRIRYAGLLLERMRPGEFRLLSQEEAFRLETIPETAKPAPRGPGGSMPGGKERREERKPRPSDRGEQKRTSLERNGRGSDRNRPSGPRNKPAGERGKPAGERSERRKPAGERKPSGGRKERPAGGKPGTGKKPTPRNSPSSSR